MGSNFRNKILQDNLNFEKRKDNKDCAKWAEYIGVREEVRKKSAFLFPCLLRQVKYIFPSICGMQTAYILPTLSQKDCQSAKQESKNNALCRTKFKPFATSYLISLSSFICKNSLNLSWLHFSKLSFCGTDDLFGQREYDSAH